MDGGLGCSSEMVALVEKCAVVAMVEHACGGFGKYARYTGIAC